MNINVRKGLTNPIIIIFLFLSTLFPYLEWGGQQKTFLFEIEYQVILTIFNDPIKVLHPLILIPMIGQCLILYFGLFAKRNLMVYVGIILIGVLMTFIILGGLMSSKIAVILSCFPFILCSTSYIYFNNRKVSRQ